MRAKRLLAAAVLGGIVGAAGCETCQSCGKKSDGVPAGYGGAVGSTLPAGQSAGWQTGGSAAAGQLPPATGVGRTGGTMPPGTGMQTGAGTATGAYGGTAPAGGFPQ